MRQPGAIRRRQHRRQRHSDRRRQVDIAHCPRKRERPCRRLQCVTQRAAQTNEDAAGRRRAHRAHRRHPAPDQQRHGQAAAADANNGRHHPDAAAGHGVTGALRHLRGIAAGLRPHQQHLRRHDPAVSRHAPAQHVAIQRDRETAPQPATQQHAGHHPRHRRPQHAAATVVRARRSSRSQHDAGQRAGQCHVHRRFRRHALAGQQPRQCPYQHQPAANAQQPGHHASESAQREIQQQERHRAPSKKTFIDARL